MPEYPETSDSLISLVRDPLNRDAWQQFEQIYRPVIFRVARAKGLQHADALDLVQQVLMSVASAVDRFEKKDKQSKFRHWLSRITRNAILKALTRQPRDRATGGTGMNQQLGAIPDSDTGSAALIELEYRRELFQRAAAAVQGEVQESTWLAFELSVLQQTPIERVAAVLEISTGSVYAARSRVMRRIRNAVKQLEQLSTGAG